MRAVLPLSLILLVCSVAFSDSLLIDQKSGLTIGLPEQTYATKVSERILSTSGGIFLEKSYNLVVETITIPVRVSIKVDEVADSSRVALLKKRFEVTQTMRLMGDRSKLGDFDDSNMRKYPEFYGILRRPDGGEVQKKIHWTATDAASDVLGYHWRGSGEYLEITVEFWNIWASYNKSTPPGFSLEWVRTNALKSNPAYILYERLDESIVGS